MEKDKANIIRTIIATFLIATIVFLPKIFELDDDSYFIGVLVMCCTVWILRFIDKWYYETIH